MTYEELMQKALDQERIAEALLHRNTCCSGSVPVDVINFHKTAAIGYRIKAQAMTIGEAVEAHEQQQMF